MPASEPGAAAAEMSNQSLGSGWLAVGAGLAHGFLMLLAFPPFGVGFLSLFAVVPLAYVGVLAARRGWGVPLPGAGWFRRLWQRLRVPLLASLGILPMQLYEHQFINDISRLGYVPLAAAMSLMAGLFIALLMAITSRLPRIPVALVVPVLWAGLEVFRGELIATGYSWLLVPLPLIDVPFVAGAASITGIYGVSFLAAVPAGLIADALLPPRRLMFSSAMAAATVALCIAGLALAPGESAAPPFRIAVVQTNIPQDNKLEWATSQRLTDFARFLKLTREAAASKPDVIVWPETMFPGTFLDPAAVEAERRAGLVRRVDHAPTTDFHDRLVALQKELGIPMLVGGLGIDNLRIVNDGQGLEFKDDGHFNSVFLIRDGAVDPVRYDKQALTPFGEIMPYIEYWPWLQKQLLDLAANGMTFDLTAGRTARAFHLANGSGGAVAAATPVCFEMTKPGVCRELALQGGAKPTVLINVTNDGWFGSFVPGREQHLQIARWRALEMGVPVVRSANTGISAFIDARGRVEQRGVDGSPRGAMVDGVLVGDVRPAVPGTIYARTGDVLGWTCLAATCLMAVAAGLGKRAGRNEERPG